MCSLQMQRTVRVDWCCSGNGDGDRVKAQTGQSVNQGALVAAFYVLSRHNATLHQGTHSIASSHPLTRPVLPMQLSSLIVLGICLRVCDRVEFASHILRN